MREIKKEYTSGYLDRLYKETPEVSPRIAVTIRTASDDDIEEEAIELFEMMKGSTIDIYIASLLELPTEMPVEEHAAEQQLRYVLTRVLTTAHDTENGAGHIVNISYGTIHDNIHKMVKVAVLGINELQKHPSLEYTITFTYDFQAYRKEAEELAAREKAQAEEKFRQIQKEAEKVAEAEKDIIEDAVVEEVTEES